jgi:hypothetical protein
VLRPLLLRSMTRGSCCLAVVLVASLALAQTEFSAEIVNTEKSDAVSQAKIYLAKDKMRIEPTANSAPSAKSAGMGRGMGAVIIDLTAHTSTVLMDQQHMYMELPAAAAASGQRNLYNFFRTGDVENACADWLQQAKNQGGSCHKVGSETVNGRSTVKFEATNASGETGDFWIDPKLRFPVKWQGKNSSGELRNIQEGTQPANLFEVPAGYTKMDMGNMMQMQRPQ